VTENPKLKTETSI